MSRLSKTIITFLTLHMIASVTSQETDKRQGPQGFFGMRGKKLIEGEQFYKRKPQFFVGVKGKKDMYDINDVLEDYYKRAPMGFMGMRGKKDLFSDEKRGPMGFVGMRGKKDFFSDEKRAPMGFVGMRGKKEDEDSLYYPERFDYIPKQGSLIGQIDYNSNSEELPLLNQMLAEYLTKEDQNVDQSQSNDEHFTNEVDKRASHQFFGVRGKKSLQNKRQYDLNFRGKFIGVRGKKDLKNSGPQEIKFLLDGPFPKRKGNMGFVGMRGKKWTDVSSPEREN